MPPGYAAPRASRPISAAVSSAGAIAPRFSTWPRPSSPWPDTHPDETIERLIFGRADQSEIERAAVAAGMLTLFDAGLAAALEGVTTIEEVTRSIRTEG